MRQSAKSAVPARSNESPQPRTTPKKASPLHDEGRFVVLRALRNRNYRLFFGGQGISLIGTWMQSVAQGWLVYRLTNSATMLGAVAFAGQIPNLIVAPLAGVWVDRWPLHRLLIATQSLAMVQATILTVLTLTGHIAVWQIIALALMLGSINAFDIPGRQAFMVQMIETPADLPNAIALNSFLVNGARLIGPAVAGVIIGLIGEGLCFLANAASYIAVIAALVAMRLRRSPRYVEPVHPVRGLAEGIRYSFGFRPVRDILLLLALVSLVGAPYSTLMPVFATKILQGGPHAFGLLVAASGAGAVTAALRLASRTSVRGLGRVIALAAAIFGLGLLAFSMCRNIWLSVPLMVVTGFGLMLQLASSNTVLQTIVEDNKRGRVMSFYTMAFMGVMPIGSLIAGALAERFGAPVTLAIGGTACIAGGAIFAWRLPGLRDLLRPIYIKKGIIPEVSAGLRAATEPAMRT